MKKLIGCLLTALLVCFSVPFPALAADSGAPGVSIDDASVSGGELHLYLTMGDAGAVSKDNVGVTLGGDSLQVTGTDAFSALGEGVAYVFVADVSGSMKAQIANMKSFLGAFADSLPAQDTAALVTISGDIQKSDFTSDKSAFKAEVDKLAASDQDTNLYRGISESIDLLSAYKTAGTKVTRRAVVILSDGGEDNSTGITKDELTQKIKASRYPVFTCALLPQKATTAQIETSKVFGSFARISAGGRDYSQIQSLPDTAASIEDSLGGATRVTAKIDASKYSGKQLYLQATVSASGLELKDGFDFRVLPAGSEVSSSSTPASSSGRSSAPSSSSGRHSSSSPSASGGKTGLPAMLMQPLILIILIAAVLVIAAVVLIILIWRRKKKPLPAADEAQTKAGQPDLSTEGTTFISSSEEPELKNKPSNTQAFPSPAPSAVAAKPVVKGLKVNIVNITNRRSPVTTELNLVDHAVIGSGKDCDLVIAGDYMMSEKHCQLSYIDQKLFLNDLGSARGTAVNGVPISGSYRLEPDDLIVIGATELRVVFDL